MASSPNSDTLQYLFTDQLGSTRVTGKPDGNARRERGLGHPAPLAP